MTETRPKQVVVANGINFSRVVVFSQYTNEHLMKKLLQTAAFCLLVVGTVCAQEVTKKEAIKTTKIAQKNAKQLQKEAKQTGSTSDKKDADKTLDAAKRAEKQAKKNTK